MPIYDHNYGGLDYFRVYRSWGGKEYQEYVRIGDDRKQARRRAEEIEQRLAEEHEVYLRNLVREPDFHVRADGSIKGLRRATVERDNRLPVDVLELRINVPWADKVRRTTVSINTHGFDEAFYQSVSKIRDWYELDESAPAVKAMRASSAFYAQEGEFGAIRSVAQKAQNELGVITQGVLKGLNRVFSKA